MSVLLPGITVILLVFALIDILTKTDDQIRGLPKIAWVILVILVPVVGSIVWFAIGHDWAPGERNHGRYIEPHPPRGPVRHPRRRPQCPRRQARHRYRAGLAEAEREIEYWEAQARLKRAKEAAGEGDVTPAS